MDLENRKEIITTIKDLKENDLVMGTDGKWHRIKLLDIHTPERMFKICFKNIKTNDCGCVKCSDDHQWTIFSNLENNNIPLTIDTKTIFDRIDVLKDSIVGFPESGILIDSISEIEPEPVRCIHVYDSKDQLFEILMDFDNNQEDYYEIEGN